MLVEVNTCIRQMLVEENTCIRQVLVEVNICIRQVLVQVNICSVVPRARHCGIPAILQTMSLKNAPSAGLRARPPKFLLFKPRFRI